jgi:hypothetical protein
MSNTRISQSVGQTTAPKSGVTGTLNRAAERALTLLERMKTLRSNIGETVNEPIAAGRDQPQESLVHVANTLDAILSELNDQFAAIERVILQ